MPPTIDEDGEAHDAWIFHSTPSHPRVGHMSPDCASPSSLFSPLEKKTRREGHSSNTSSFLSPSLPSPSCPSSSLKKTTKRDSPSSHCISGYSPHLFFSPSPSPRAQPLHESTEKRSKLLRRMREPDKKSCVSREDLNKGQFLGDFQTQGLDRKGAEKDGKEKVQLISIKTVTKCNTEDDSGLEPDICAKTSSVRTAKKKLMMEETNSTIEKKVKVKPKRSFSVSQTVVTSTHTKGDQGMRMAESNKKGRKRFFSRSKTTVTECKVSQNGKHHGAENVGKLREKPKRFRWSPIVGTGFSGFSQSSANTNFDGRPTTCFFSTPPIPCDIGQLLNQKDKSQNSENNIVNTEIIIRGQQKLWKKSNVVKIFLLGEKRQCQMSNVRDFVNFSNKHL